MYTNPLKNNKNYLNKSCEVLVENKLEGQNKYFGRTKYMTSVIFDGNDQDVGNVIKVKIDKSNQNTLFGVSLNKLEKRVA